MKQALILVLLLVAVAFAKEAYVEAVNVNYSDGFAGNVTGTHATPQATGNSLAGNWNNIVDTGPSAYGGAVNSDGYGGIWEAPPLDSSGVTLPLLQIQVNNGGWGNMYITTGGGAPGAPEYSVVYNAAGAAYGNPNHWNWYLTWQGLPVSFDNYDVYALNDGTWTRIAAGMSTSFGNMPVVHPVVTNTAALQFLQIAAPGVLLIVR